MTRVIRLTLVLTACASLLPSAARAQAPETSPAATAHFHHVHLNATDPDAAIEFYTTKFKARREKFAGADAVWTGDSWLLFTRVSEPPPSALVSPLWHIGWGAEDELNTATHHSFGHVHLFSADPVAAAEWYARHFGLRSRAQPEKRMYNGHQIGPSAAVAIDHVNMTLYPIEYIRGARPVDWKDRAGFASTRGRVIEDPTPRPAAVEPGR